MEHEEQAEQMEEEAERMEHHSDQLGERIDDAKEGWERKEHDQSVPGAQPDPEEEAGTDNPDAAGAEE
jgi:Mn-dependent DtxR family transcriptional regulator